MPFYEKGNVRIRYEEAGSGFPLFIINGGGLNSSVFYPARPSVRRDGGVQIGVPLHRDGPAQRQRRAICDASNRQFL
jgi:hypothetical protein